MRYIVLLALLMPCSAQAADTVVRVRYVIAQERIRPEPKVVRATVFVRLILKDNGEVEDHAVARGKYSRSSDHRAKLGGDRIKVIDAHTITRTTHVGNQTLVLTVKTEGSGCAASLDISGPPEMVARSIDLNTMATYRNTRIESMDCTIE